MSIVQVFDQYPVSFFSATTRQGRSDKQLKVSSVKPPSGFAVLGCTITTQVFIGQQFFEAGNKGMIRHPFHITTEVQDSVVKGNQFQINTIVVVFVLPVHHTPSGICIIQYFPDRRFRSLISRHSEQRNVLIDPPEAALEHIMFPSPDQIVVINKFGPYPLLLLFFKQLLQLVQNKLGSPRPPNQAMHFATRSRAEDEVVFAKTSSSNGSTFGPGRRIHS